MNSPPPASVFTTVNDQPNHHVPHAEAHIRLNKANQKKLRTLLRRHGRDLDDFRGEGGEYDYLSILSWTLDASAAQRVHQMIDVNATAGTTLPGNFRSASARQSPTETIFISGPMANPRPLLERHAESTGVDPGMVSSLRRVLPARRTDPESPIRHEYKLEAESPGDRSDPSFEMVPLAPDSSPLPEAEAAPAVTADSRSPGRFSAAARLLLALWSGQASVCRPRPRPCHVMIAALVLVLAGSGALGLYYAIAWDRMGDGFTAAGWIVAAAALVEAAWGAHHFADGRCRCWRPPRPLDEYGAVARTRTIPRS